MATQAALLYQEAPVGVFLPNSAEKAKPMPNSTSANRAAITTLIDVFLFSFSQPRSRHVGRQSVLIIVKRLQNSQFFSLPLLWSYPTARTTQQSVTVSLYGGRTYCLRSNIPPLQLCHYPHAAHTLIKHRVLVVCSLWDAGVSLAFPRSSLWYIWAVIVFLHQLPKESNTFSSFCAFFWFYKLMYLLFSSLVLKAVVWHSSAFLETDKKNCATCELSS